jgi:hypothetical protein
VDQQAMVELVQHHRSLAHRLLAQAVAVALETVAAFIQQRHRARAVRVVAEQVQTQTRQLEAVM